MPCALCKQDADLTFYRFWCIKKEGDGERGTPEIPLQDIIRQGHSFPFSVADLRPGMHFIPLYDFTTTICENCRQKRAAKIKKVFKRIFVFGLPSLTVAGPLIGGFAISQAGGDPLGVSIFAAALLTYASLVIIGLALLILYVGLLSPTQMSIELVAQAVRGKAEFKGYEGFWLRKPNRVTAVYTNGVRTGLKVEFEK